MPFGTATLMGILESQEYITQRLVVQNKSLIPLRQSVDLRVHHATHKTQQLRGTQDLSLTAVDDVGNESWTDEHDHTEDPEFSHNDAHAPSIFSLQRRTTQDCGIYRMDCVDARSACNVSVLESIIPNFWWQRKI